MKTKRYLAASIALLIFIFVYESIVHGMLLINIYQETPTIWRSQSDMMSYMPFNIFVMVLLSLWLTFIFTRFFKQGGWRNGLRFGFYIGVLSGIQAAGAFYFLPISAALAGCWFIAYLIECIAGGFIIGTIYRA
jgi:energy-converting hydrogenase Eha subunit A